MHSYCIVYINVNAYANEQLSIGLFAFDESNIYYKWSKQKLKIIKPLLLKYDCYNLVKMAIESIDNYHIQEYKKALKNNKVNDYIISVNTILNHNHIHCNNLILYSKVKEIRLELSEGWFNKQFNELIYNEK